MNIPMKDQIISELDSLSDQKMYSLLNYLHFLKQENEMKLKSLQNMIIEGEQSGFVEYSYENLVKALDNQN